MVRRKQQPRTSGSSSPPPPAVAATGGRLRPLLPLASCLLLLALLYPEPLFQSRVFGAADTAAAAAFRQVGDAARQAGDYPLWNPYIFLGLPSFGSLAYTHGVYPPTLVFEWLQGLGLPPLTWLFGHLLFGGLGMWWLLGRWRTPWPARLLGVVVWLWSARLVAWAAHGHGTKLGAEMYLPWLLGLTLAVLDRGGLRPAALAALLLGLQFLRGHLQISFYTLALLGFVTLWHLIRPLRPQRAMVSRRRQAGLMLAVVALGFAIGAVLLVPVHSYTSFSTRGAGGASGGEGSAFDYATDWSLGPEDLAAMVLPAAAGFGKATYFGRMPFTDSPNYLGFLVPLLAGAAWLNRRRRGLAWALAVVSLLALLLAMGRFSPGLYQLAYAVVPYFDKFRVPAMVLVLVFLSLAVLAALGAAELTDPRRDASRWLRRAAWSLLAVGGLLFLLGATGLGEGGQREFLTGLAERGQRSAPAILLAEAWKLHQGFLVRGGLILLAAGGACLLAARRDVFRRRGLPFVLLLLVALDFGQVARLVTHPQRGLKEVVRLPDGSGRLVDAAPLVQPWSGPVPVQVAPDLAARLAETVGHGRLLPLGDDAMSNAYMTAGVRSLGGYHPAKPAAAEAVRQRLYGSRPAYRLARWLGATAATYPERLSDEILVLLRQQGLDLDPASQAAGGTRVYRVRDPLPRARLQDRYVLAEGLPGGADLDSFLDLVASGRHDAAARTALDRIPVPSPEAGDEPLPVPEFLRDGLDEVVLRVDTPRPALLVLADLAAPGWRATVDGRDAAMLRADHILRAVALPAGQHEVRFIYEDPALERGLWLALAGLLGVAGLLAGAWYVERRRPDHPQPVANED